MGPSESKTINKGLFYHSNSLRFRDMGAQIGADKSMPTKN